MARVLSVSADLMLGSRVVESLKGAGHEVLAAGSIAEADLGGLDAIVVDLDAENPQAVVGLGAPVLGYYSHVDVETRRAAEASGVDLVVPRSRMSRELPQLVQRLLTA